MSNGEGFGSRADAYHSVKQSCLQPLFAPFESIAYYVQTASPPYRTSHPFQHLFKKSVLQRAF